MAIGTDDLVLKWGTTDDLDSSSANVADGAFSVAGDLDQTWTNTDDAPMATIVFLGTFTATPTAGAVVNIYCRPLNIADTTKDHGTTGIDADQLLYLGSCTLTNGTSEQVRQIEVALPLQQTSQGLEFYVENQGGSQLNAGWSLQITPKTYGPAA